MSPAGRTTLLNLICAAIAAFDLSPYTLSASQLQAVVDILANLYEGKACVSGQINGCQCVVAPRCGAPGPQAQTDLCRINSLAVLGRPRRSVDLFS